MVSFGLCLIVKLSGQIKNVQLFCGESFDLMLVIIIIIAITTTTAITITIITITITTIIVMIIVAKVFIIIAIIARLVGAATSSLLIGQFHLFDFQFIGRPRRKGKICIFYNDSI